MKNTDLVAILIQNGYKKLGAGYCKDTKEIRHWVTFLGKHLQIWSDIRDREETEPNEKPYDTGIIKRPTMVEFSILILIFNTNHI